MDISHFVRIFVRENHEQNPNISNHGSLAAVNFYLDTHPNKAGECPVKMSVIIRKKRFFPTIGHSVSPDVWKNGRVARQKYENSKGTLATKINQDILDLQSHFTRYAVEVDHIPTPEEFKAEMRKALGKSDPTAKTSTAPKARTIFDDIDQFVQEEGVACQWATSTIQNWETFKKRLHRFNPGIKYSDFNEEGLTKFVNFLRAKDHLEENTTQKQFNNLKWFLNWAIRKGYCSESQINRYRPKFRILEKPVIFLTKEELLTLYRYDIPANGTNALLRHGAAPSQRHHRRLPLHNHTEDPRQTTHRPQQLRTGHPRQIRP